MDKRKINLVKATLAAQGCASVDQIKREAYFDRLNDKYEMTPADYASQIRAQWGRCPICGERPKNRHSGMGTHSGLVADHCHQSGKWRALLCSRCNLLIGSAKEDITILLAAAEYLWRAKNDIPILNHAALPSHADNLLPFLDSVDFDITSLVSDSAASIAPASDSVTAQPPARA